MAPKNVRVNHVYRCVECDKHVASQWPWHEGMGTNLPDRWLEITQSSLTLRRNVETENPDGTVTVTFHEREWKIKTFAGMRCPNFPRCTSETFDEAPHVRIFKRA